MDERGQALLHAHGRAAPADVARGGKQLLQGEQLALLVARDAGRHLEIHLVLAGDDAHEEPRAVAPQHDGLEHLFHVFTQTRGHVHRAEVTLVHHVGDKLVGHTRLVEQAGGIGLCCLVAHIITIVSYVLS